MRPWIATLLIGAIAPAVADDPATLGSQLRARQQLDAAVAAIGGEAALRGLRTIRREYTEDWVDVGQAPRPWNGSPAVDALPPHAGSDDSPTTSYIDYAGGRLYTRARFADGPDDFAVFVDVATPERAFQSIAYVRETPYLTERTREEGEAQRRGHLRHHPEALLRLALERADTLLSLGAAREHGARFDLVAFSDVDGTQLVLYLDARSHRPARVETRRGHRVYGDTTADVVFTDYRRVGALELPHAWSTRVAGVPVRRFQASTIVLDTPSDEAWFRVPASFVRTEPSPATPRVEPLGLGLYLIRASYNLTFAELSDRVVLVEAPIGEPFMEQVLALVEATAPGKPVTVVATHFHFDHVGGVRTAVAHGLPVLTTPDAAPVIERSLASRQAIRPDALARAPRPARIETVVGRKVIADAGQLVELYDVGPAPHVAQLLVAYYPRQKVLHVGDLFDPLTTEQVLAGVDTEVLARRIRELGLDVERIVPTHGVPVTMRDLERAMAIRRQYQEGTR